MGTLQSTAVANLERSIELISGVIDSREHRVIAIMGPNGSGKSRLLKGLSRKIAEHNPLLIPAQRSIQNYYNIHQLDRRLAGTGEEDPLKKAFDILTGKSSTQQFSRNDVGVRMMLDNMLSQILSRMHLDDKNLDRLYKERLLEWDAADGSIETKPNRPASKVQGVALKLGSIIEKKCRITFEEDSGSAIGVAFDYNGEWINLSQISDGERQIVLIAILRLAQDNATNFLLVDEPELHLNESLACSTWGQFEEAFPECTMVYATHSVFFATRPQVEKLYLLDMACNIEEISTPNFPPSSAINNIIGSRIQFLRSEKRTIYCEDELSAMIIEDLMAGLDLDVRILPGREAVESAIQSERIWTEIRTAGPKIAGVVDRDAQSDEEIQGKEQSGLFCLPFYDAEAIFQHEAIGLWLINLPKSSTDLVTRARFSDLIVECARHRHSVTLKKHAAHITRQNQANIKYRDDGSGYVITKVEMPIQIEGEFQQRIKACQDALDDQDLSQISVLFYGKDVYKSFKMKINKEFGVAISDDAETKYKELRKTYGFQEQIKAIMPLQDLRSKLISYLGL